MNTTIENLESNVRSYCRSFPATFTRAKGATLEAADGKSYIDFFAGAGTLNYGHNHPVLQEALIRYIASDGVTHGLDLTTEAKTQFLETFNRLILSPRGLDYKTMFPGPTGTNAVESAIKLARKVTGRHNIVSFTNAFHGMTLGSLALTGNSMKRAGGGVQLSGVSRLPFDGYMEGMDTAEYLDRVLCDTSSGVDKPAAIILETIQAEGGINTASFEWLKKIQRISRKHGALFIIDDIQVGCGRTGTFFSFEKAGLTPDVVCLSKSLSGYGLPFAITMFHRDIDAFSPGEHNGTFRGHNLAFITAEKAIATFWSDDSLNREVDEKAVLVRDRLEQLAGEYGGIHKGRGFLQGVAFNDQGLASAASGEAFERGLIIETSGANDEVLKVLAPLTIGREQLLEGLDIVSRSVKAAADKRAARRVNVSLPARAEA